MRINLKFPNKSEIKAAELSMNSFIKSIIIYFQISMCNV